MVVYIQSEEFLGTFVLYFISSKYGMLDKIFKNINIIVFINKKSVIYKFSLFVDLRTLDLFCLLNLLIRVALSLAYPEDLAWISITCHSIIRFQGWKELQRDGSAFPLPGGDRVHLG